MSLPGTFITFEGIDGSGKSTLARLLCKQLQELGVDVILTREPGGSPGGEAVRKLLLDDAHFRWSREAEILLFNAARRDHVDKVIEPALRTGKTVICDRFVDSTRVYQGLRSPDMLACIESLHRDMIGLEPDLTFVLSVTPSVAVERARTRSKEDWRLEQLGERRMQEIVTAFRKIADTHSDRCHAVDTTSVPVEILAERILDTCLKKMHAR